MSGYARRRSQHEASIICSSMTRPSRHDGSQIAMTNLQMPLESRPPSISYFYLNLGA
jgi:hypothetical protein